MNENTPRAATTKTPKPAKPKGAGNKAKGTNTPKGGSTAKKR